MRRWLRRLLPFLNRQIRRDAKSIGLYPGLTFDARAWAELKPDVQAYRQEKGRRDG